MKDNQVTHSELVQRFADALESMEGEAMVRLWNAECDDQVKYIGDSVYEWVTEEEKTPPKDTSCHGSYGTCHSGCTHHVPKKKPLPPCPICDGEIELGPKLDTVECHSCGYSGVPPGFSA